MTFDALTLAAIRAELHAALLHGQIQRITQPEEMEIGLAVYARGKRHYVMLSAHPESARVCLTDERPQRGSATATPLLLLLRKYTRDGRIVGFRQPAYERVLTMQIAKRDNEDPFRQLDLIIETMGRRSNVILVDSDGKVVEALRRAGPVRNSRRPVLPRHPYQPPPAQGRLDPLAAATFDELRFLAPTSGLPIEALLATRLAGFSPLAAREAAFRAVGALGRSAAGVDWNQVRSVVAEFLEPLSTGEWQPCLAAHYGRIAAFAPYPLNHLVDHELRPLASISQAVELALRRRSEASTQPVKMRSLLAEIDAKRKLVERKQASLGRALEQAKTAADLRTAAEAILASLTNIEPGQGTLVFDGREIRLDPRLSGLENAQRLFRQYQKLRGATQRVPALLQRATFGLRQLEELRALAEIADTPARLYAIGEELAELKVEGTRQRPPPPTPKRPGKQGRRREGRDQKAAVRGARGQFLRSLTPDGLEVLVGASSRGNETVTFRLATADDLWLHARGVPGAHVVLRTGGREPSAASLAYAARLAARNSRAREAGRVDVDTTQRKRVRRIPGAPPGLVSYSGERTLSVETSD